MKHLDGQKNFDEFYQIKVRIKFKEGFIAYKSYGREITGSVQLPPAGKDILKRVTVKNDLGSEESVMMQVNLCFDAPEILNPTLTQSQRDALRNKGFETREIEGDIEVL